MYNPTDATKKIGLDPKLFSEHHYPIIKTRLSFYGWFPANEVGGPTSIDHSLTNQEKRTHVMKFMVRPGEVMVIAYEWAVEESTGAPRWFFRSVGLITENGQETWS